VDGGGTFYFEGVAVELPLVALAAHGSPELCIQSAVLDGFVAVRFPALAVVVLCPHFDEFGAGAAVDGVVFLIGWLPGVIPSVVVPVDELDLALELSDAGYFWVFGRPVQLLLVDCVVEGFYVFGHGDLLVLPAVGPQLLAVQSLGPVVTAVAAPLGQDLLLLPPRN
jgi:hypothetical protein